MKKYLHDLRYGIIGGIEYRAGYWDENKDRVDKKLICYPSFWEELLSKMQLARYEMLKTVSKQKTVLYWEKGKAVSQKAQQDKGGNPSCNNVRRTFKPGFPVYVAF